MQEEEKSAKRTARRIMNCVMEERIEELEGNLALMIDHQIGYGRTENEIENLVNDCIEYITNRIKEAQGEDESPAEFLNLFNTIIISMTYTTLNYQRSMIARTAKDKGVTEGTVIDELLIEMDSEMQKGSHG